jgi:3-oxoacyl-[acyl-carrier protein] reductase
VSTPPCRASVLITGASRGIGRAAALLFARAGYTVFANYRRDARGLFELSTELRSQGFSLTPLQADVTNAAEVEDMAAKTGGVFVLLNNAGAALREPFMSTSEAQWRACMDNNLTSAYIVTRAVLPYMLRHRRGCIINVSSVWGLTGGSCEAAYSAAKAGLLGLTKALAKELAPSGIRCCAIAPGIIDTDMNAGLDAREIAQSIPLGRMGAPEEAAAAALFLAEHEYITGAVLNICGGFAIIP